jgi:hypothetical protein
MGRSDEHTPSSPAFLPQIFRVGYHCQPTENTRGAMEEIWVRRMLDPVFDPVVHS